MLDLNPLIVRSSQFHGDWKRYYDALYEYFCQDFIEDSPYFGDCEVIFTGTGTEDGKEKTFWHIVTVDNHFTKRGKAECERIPDYKRAERVRWIKEIIENYDDPDVRVFREIESTRHIFYLWFKEEFIVILGRGIGYKKFYLISAYYLNEWMIKKYQKKWETSGLKKEDVARATSYPFKP